MFSVCPNCGLVWMSIAEFPRICWKCDTVIERPAKLENGGLKPAADGEGYSLSFDLIRKVNSLDKK